MDVGNSMDELFAAEGIVKGASEVALDEEVVAIAWTACC
jgi:hypothetical protein